MADLVNGAVVVEPTPPLRVVKADAAILEAHWPFLRDKLLIIKNNAGRPSLRERIAARREKRPLLTTHGRARWTPEQVRWAILRGIAGQTSLELYLSVGPDEAGADIVKGFFVTTCELDPFLQTPVDFFIWLAWAGYPGVVEFGTAEAERIARSKGCTGIEHTSPRLGWHRRLLRHGYSLKYIVYRRSLVDGD